MVYVEGCDIDGVRFCMVTGMPGFAERGLMPVQHQGSIRCDHCMENVRRPCRPEESGDCINRRQAA